MEQTKPWKERTWKELPLGGVIPAAESEPHKTGTWRTLIPVIDPEKCVNCMICWAVCPDNAIIPENGNFGHFDYFHCKGCGLCAQHCPVKAIEMKIEADIDKSKIPKGINLE